VISRFIQGGGHKHIINYFEHGWLHGVGAVYYIDMELASMSLEEYMKSFRMRPPTERSQEIQQIPSIYSQFFQNNNTPIEKIHNVWTIGLQMALGLEFLHSQSQVHRDLKPSNGAPFY